MDRTKYWQVNANNPESEIIEQAARLITAGELVAFPTETVYGLGADAFQPLAVGKIFLAKGRPSENPLLVHVSNLAQAYKLTLEMPHVARKLMDRFWPGPLSIILPSLPAVPEIVRGGQHGVGLRMPSHPVALALIEATGPLAAPSANLYGRPSPTNALHVRQDLDGKIAAVLDAGDTGAGLESTIIDLTGEKCKVLRRGGISMEVLQEFLGVKIELAEAGTLPRYKTKVQVVISNNQSDYEMKLNAFLAQGLTIGVIHIHNDPDHKIGKVKNQIFTYNLSESEMNLYSILREAEENGIFALLIAPFDQERVGAAFMDRLRRAVSQ